jgi:pyridinium-3,5-biscarboxylic acid mononucleotide sulfurtransferase
MDGDFSILRDSLLAWFKSVESCAVALSAGVDSGVVAKAAFLALGDKAVAVTGASDSLARGELEEARELAKLIGIRHYVIETREFEKPEYLRNAPDRCYHCKTELYDQMQAAAPSLGVACIINGLNVDDLGDYRPGILAAKEHAVRSPLAECGINKAQVRELAAHWGLPIWDKPATPCLSSRVAYGEEVTPERLAKIDEAERYLRSLGLRKRRLRRLQNLPASRSARNSRQNFRVWGLSSLRSTCWGFVRGV